MTCDSLLLVGGQRSIVQDTALCCDATHTVLIMWHYMVSRTLSAPALYSHVTTALHSLSVLLQDLILMSNSRHKYS